MLIFLKSAILIKAIDRTFLQVASRDMVILAICFHEPNTQWRAKQKDLHNTNKKNLRNCSHHSQVTGPGSQDTYSRVLNRDLGAWPTRRTVGRKSVSGDQVRALYALFT